MDTTSVSRRKHLAALLAVYTIGLAPLGMMFLPDDVSQKSFSILGVTLILTMLVFMRLRVAGFLEWKSVLELACLFILAAYLLFGFAFCMPAVSDPFFRLVQVFSPFLAIFLLCHAIAIVDRLCRERS